MELYVLPDTSTSSIPPSAPAATTKRGGGGTTLYEGSATFHLLNPNGRRAYVHDANVGLIECDLGIDGDDDDPVERRGRATKEDGVRPFREGDSRSVQLAKCSPRGSYFLTWERPGKGGDGGDGDDGGNLKAWDASTGKFLRGFHCKNATLNGLQWTHDESLAFHLVTNDVHVYCRQWSRGRIV